MTVPIFASRLRKAGSSDQAMSSETMPIPVSAIATLSNCARLALFKSIGHKFAPLAHRKDRTGKWQAHAESQDTIMASHVASGSTNS
jgi:hypothetical protein